ncbi:MAG: CDP-glycerol glycerophosphotransferase family protein, partial [Oscillospiraceae bacterium]|nr:CDP-glycerol glycerophosphotransferase family protein [Oscillospiraceae bacterium]
IAVLDKTEKIKYIKQALEGFVHQETDFVYKVFVGDDCSTDSTPSVVREYAEKYPDIIYPIPREKNMGAQRNLIDLCERACSPYIAFCEGDDFWIDNHKLQKQFDYMESHPSVRMCYTHTEILAPDDWHLNSYYKHNKEGKMIIPECTPGFIVKDYYRVSDFITVFPNHTSSAFYRWDYDLEFPEWYFTGLIGDTPATMLQMGMGRAVYLPDVTSVYRRSDVGVFMNKSDDDHFANTRLDYVRLLSGTRDYFEANLSPEFSEIFSYRIRREIANLFQAAERLGRTELVVQLSERYPTDLINALHAFVGSYNVYSALTRKMTPEEKQELHRASMVAVFLKPVLAVIALIRGAYHFVIKAINAIYQRALGTVRFWLYGFTEKDDDLWVFSGFRAMSYMDNTKYLYEYILNNHPEINPMWLTNSSAVLEQLKKDGYPVVYLYDKEGRDLLRRAAVAVTDHFVVTDFPSYRGFNIGTKVVQLWHGVRFKAMGDKKNVRNTTERGVRYSGDIIPDKKDNIFVKFIKRIKYFFAAPFRERFEEYFMFVCPGQERLEMMADMWNVPRENCFMAGHPRNAPLFEKKDRTDLTNKVIYAPTYRFNADHEKALVRSLLNNAEAIEDLMEKCSGSFVIRLHPHTWRNYNGMINSVIKDYPAISLDDSDDVYETLGDYSVLISDYSSIAVDFALLDRPVIFLCEDYEWFNENEAGFNLDFLNMIPGVKTDSWAETVDELEKCLADPTRGSELRRERLNYFYDANVNGIDDSERIVQEIKSRLKKQ